VPQSIEWIKGLFFAELQDPPGARHPIFAVRVNQVANDIENGPGIFPFAAMSPTLRQTAQQPIQSGGSARKQRDCLFQIVFHASSRR